MITWLKSLFAHPAPAPAQASKPTDPNAAAFGYIDTNDGTFYPGYITPDGKMAYSKIGEKGTVWQAPEAVGTWEGDQRWHSHGLFQQPKTWTEPISGVVYRQKHRFKDEALYFIGSPSAPEYIEPDAWVKLGRIVQI